MEFRPPQFRQQYSPPTSLDSLFNAYLQMKADGRLAEDRQNQSFLQGLSLRDKYNGVDPRGMTPEQLDRGFAGPAMPSPAAPNPGQPFMQGMGWDGLSAPPMVPGMAAPVTPMSGQPQFDEDPRVAGVQQFMQQKRQGQQRGFQKDAAALANTQADTAYKQAQEWSLRNPRQANTGTNRPPPGYRFLPDGDLEAIPGGPAAAKAEALGERELAAQNSALEQADAQIVKVDQALKNVTGWSTGWGGATFGRLPGSQAKDLQGDLDTIKANLGFSTLAEMKRASPSGGALGAISESEMRLLTSARESLDREQSEDQLRRNLQAVKTHYTNWRNAVMKAREGGGPAGSPVGNVRVQTPDGKVWTLPERSVDAALARGARRL